MDQRRVERTSHRAAFRHVPPRRLPCPLIEKNQGRTPAVSPGYYSFRLEIMKNLSPVRHRKWTIIPLRCLISTTRPLKIQCFSAKVPIQCPCLKKQFPVPRCNRETCRGRNPAVQRDHVTDPRRAYGSRRVHIRKLRAPDPRVPLPRKGAQWCNERTWKSQTSNAFIGSSAAKDACLRWRRCWI